MENVQQQQEQPGVTFDLTKPPSTAVGRIEVVDLGDGQSFALAPNPSTDVRETTLAVDIALSVVIDFIRQSQRIEGDPTLTPVGKTKKREPLV